MTKTTSKKIEQAPHTEVYTRVTDRIVSDLVKGERTWFKPWSAEHATDRLPSLPVRSCGTPYRVVNVPLL
jgi:antirestriction protein ArdC